MILFSIAHGVISLERHSPEFGVIRRRLQVPKMRGRAFREGYHDFRLRRGGIEVFPRLVAAEHATAPRHGGDASSGIARLDGLVGGGLSRGTSTLLLGPAGSGKSTVATQFLLEAARRGERSVAYLFDESLDTFLQRARGLGQDLSPHLDAGTILLRRVDSAELTPGEFAGAVRVAVEQEGVSLVAIDSLNGYLHAMSEEKLLLVHLHELLTYLGQRGVTTLMLMAQHGIVGQQMAAPVDTTYLADTVLLFRFFEATGEVRRAIAMTKRRTGAHERTIRELRLSSAGLEVGEPLSGFQGVLTGELTLLDASRGEGHAGA
jgi:circadian clock protein KaiC